METARPASGSLSGQLPLLLPVRGRAARHGVRLLLSVPRPGSAARQVMVFATIGVVSTIAYAILYSALRLAVEPVVANGLALVVTAIGNTAANRRLTFDVRGRDGAVRDQVGGLVAFGVALAITTAAVSVLEAVAPDAGRALELTVLIAANALATICRLLLLRHWITGARRPSTADTPGALR